MTQEIIVYRNPGEKAFWDFIMSANAFPLMIGVVVFFAVFLSVYQISTRGRYQRNNLYTYGSLAVAVVAAVLTVKFLWI